MAKTSIITRLPSSDGGVSSRLVHPVSLEKRSLSDSHARGVALKRQKIPEKSSLKVKTQRESLQKHKSEMQDVSLHSSETRSISFSTIEIRCYNRRLGDNPAVPCGAPLTIDWNYTSRHVVTVDDYEKDRPSYFRKDKDMLIVGSQTREDWLREAGHSSGEILEATQLATRVRNQRLRTLKQVVVKARQEETKRKLKRGVNKMLGRKQKPQDSNELGVRMNNYLIASGI